MLFVLFDYCKLSNVNITGFCDVGNFVEAGLSGDWEYGLIFKG